MKEIYEFVFFDTDGTFLDRIISTEKTTCMEYKKKYWNTVDYRQFVSFINLEELKWDAISILIKGI